MRRISWLLLLLLPPCTTLLELPRLATLSAEGDCTMAKVTVFFLVSSLESSQLSGSQAYCQASVPPQSSNIWSSATYSAMLDLVRNLIFFTAAGGSHPFITLKAAFKTQGISRTRM